MSRYIVNGDMSVNETQLRILRAVLENDNVVDDKKVGVTGYSLSKGDPKIAIATWNDNYPILERDLLITRTNEKESTGRGNKNYSITPIGIFILINKIESVDRYLLKKIFQCCLIHYEKGKNKTNKVISKNILFHLDKVLKNKYFNDSEEIQTLFHIAIKKVIIIHSQTFLDIGLFYNVPTAGLDVELTKLQYLNEGKKYSLHFDINTCPGKRKRYILKKEEFNFYLSKFLICAFLHNLFKEKQWEVNEIKYFMKKEKDENKIKSFRMGLNEHEEILNSFDEELVKSIKSFQTDIEKAVEYHLKEFKKLS